MTDQELMHFGIPGMKWGVRRAHKLSSKLGVTVGEGISKRHAKGALKYAEKFKKKALSEARRDWLHRKITDREYDKLEESISRLKATSITKKFSERGKAFYEAQLEPDKNWKRPGPKPSSLKSYDQKAMDRVEKKLKKMTPQERKALEKHVGDPDDFDDKEFYEMMVDDFVEKRRKT